MTLRLNPHLPLLWRTPTSLQLGFDPPVVRLDLVTPASEHLLGALRAGASLTLLERLGSEAGLSRAGVHALLHSLRPALEGMPATDALAAGEPIGASGASAEADDAGLGGADPTVGQGSWAIAGSHPLALSIARIADAARLDPPRTRVGTDTGAGTDASSRGTRAAAPALVLLVDNYVIPPHRYAPWLARDIPHLAVVCHDRHIRIGPLVEPGTGPCIGCAQRYAAGADPAWPALAVQAHRRTAASATSILATLAIGPILAAIHSRLRAHTRELRAATLLVDGSSVSGRREPVLAHPECGCGALGSAENLGVPTGAGAPSR
ncbi:hypothetical protein D9V32_06305 [Mycetocola tolaasinivorans]|uniref:TOMM leader peptide-binding protein n=1 Tax=Mycetocola tolaasinivorans TaxID=76635 RepID=A0A3L7A9D5_9MICO|nr:TOMM precursor leader peptide-binding protein [Mycetocola tolaasinivorans]RLP76468.1 hypothetical protein D9V32_06305 [Mycetocola tolaasinivorans]